MQSVILADNFLLGDFFVSNSHCFMNCDNLTTNNNMTSTVRSNCCDYYHYVMYERL